MKTIHRRGIVALSLIAFALGATGLQAISFAQGGKLKKKTSVKAPPAKWNGAVVFKQDRLVCTDEELLKLNGYKDPLNLASFYVCFSGDSDYNNNIFNGIQLYFLFMEKRKPLRYDVVMNRFDELDTKIGKNPELRVVVSDENISLPWKEAMVGDGGNGPQAIVSIQSLGGLLKAGQLSLVARDRKTKIIVAATSLGPGPPAGVVSDPGGFIVKPPPTPPPAP